MQNVKAIPWEFQHALVVADIDRKKIRNVVKNTCTEKKYMLAERFEDQEVIEEKVIGLVDV